MFIVRLSHMIFEGVEPTAHGHHIRKSKLIGCHLLIFMVAIILLSAVSELTYAEENPQSASESVGTLSVSVPFDRVHPIAVISREDIQRTGVTYIGSLLFEDGADINELGLYRSLIAGSGSVAFLLNGKSVSSSTIEYLPVRVIERIEILGDSAATMNNNYDIGGAINVVIRRDSLQGVEFWADVERPSEPGAEVESTGMLWSPESESTDVVVGIERWTRDHIWARNRDYSKSVWEKGGHYADTSNVSIQGNTVSSSRGIRALGSCDDKYYTGNLDYGAVGSGNTVCGFPYGNYAVVVGPNNQYMGSDNQSRFFFDFETDLSDSASIYSNFVYATKKAHSRFAPSVGQISIPANLLPSTHDLFDADQSAKVVLYHRFLGHGNRDWNEDVSRYDLSVGLRNKVRDGFQYDVSLFASSYDYGEIGNTFVSQSEIERIITSPPDGADYAFYNPLSTEVVNLAAIKLSSLTSFRDIKTSTTGARAIFSGLDDAIGNNAFRWKFGTDYTRTKRTDNLDHRDVENKSYALEDVLGSGGSSASGKRDTWAVFGESVFAVGSNLELSIAGRYEKPSDTVNTLASQIAAQVSLSDHLKLRTAIGQTERAPGFFDLYLDETIGYPYVCDVVVYPICATGTTSQVRASSRQYKTEYLGNLNLKPGKVGTINFGLQADLHPFRMEVNYIENDHKNTPVSPTAQIVVQLEKDGKLPLGAEVKRRPGANNTKGQIEKITIPTLNNGKSKVKGLDVRSSVKRDMNWGELDIGLNIFHTLSTNSSIGGIDTSTDFPKNRINLRLTGSRSNMSMTWNIGAISSYWNADRTGRYESWLGHDLIFNWREAFNVPNLAVRATVINVSDKGPIVNPANNVLAPTTPISSVIGRTIGISAEMKW